MGSYVQVIIGGMLLVTAFLFGRHINGKPIVVTSSTEQSISNQPSLNLQANADLITKGNETDSPPIDPNFLQRTLRDRILGERKQGKLKLIEPVVGGTLRNEQKTNPFSLAENDIVVPDFSHLDHEPSSQLPPAEGFPLKRLKKPFQNAKPTESQLPGEGLLDNVIVGPIPSDSHKDQDALLPSRQLHKLQSGFPSNRVLESDSPKRDMITKQGVIDISSSMQKLIPVRHRQNKLTSNADEFVSYTTVFGDTLHGLSSRFFGRPDYYLDIYLANKQLFENPSTVPVNTKIRIPVMAELIVSENQF